MRAPPAEIVHRHHLAVAGPTVAQHGERDAAAQRRAPAGRGDMPVAARVGGDDMGARDQGGVVGRRQQPDQLQPPGPHRVRPAHRAAADEVVAAAGDHGAEAAIVGIGGAVGVGPDMEVALLDAQRHQGLDAERHRRVPAAQRVHRAAVSRAGTAICRRACP
jgi:hypothetical protein